MLMVRLYWSLLVLLLFTGAQARAATTLVRAGENLQTALNNAQPGDVLLLQAGATFSGNFVLPMKSGTATITVRSSGDDAQLPPAGVRIRPAYAPLLAKIQSPNAAPAIRAAPGAHHWRLMLLEFPATHLGYGEIVRLGEGSSAQSDLGQVPYEIELDRVYVHGDPLYGQKRGVALNGRAVTIRNSYVSDIKAVGVDTQAIGGWNGPGPFTIQNNYLEASGENFLLGGSDPAIPGLVSEDLLFRYNYLSKPMAWRNPVIASPAAVSAAPLPGAGVLPPGTYSYLVVARRPAGGGATARSTPVAASVTLGTPGGVAIAWTPVSGAADYRVYGRFQGAVTQHWTTTTASFTDSGAAGTADSAPPETGDTWQVKNLFELKNARHAIVEHNIIENNWQNAQPGYAVLFTPRNQDGACSWCVVEDVTFQYNVVRNSSSAVNLSGYDWPNASAQTNNVRIRENLFYGITTTLGGSGWFLLIGDQPRDVVIDHNTIDVDGTTLVYAYGGTAASPETIAGFRFTNNATRHNSYGINGANAAWGSGTLAAYFPGSVVQGNWFQGGTASRYPAGNYFSGAFEQAFVNLAAGDYRAAPGGLLTGAATDGTNIGADVEAVVAGVANVMDGATRQRPTPPPNLRVVTVSR
jgi:hypothetical protein